MVAFVRVSVLTAPTQLRIVTSPIKSHHLGPEVSFDYYKLHCSMRCTLLFAKHSSRLVANSILFHKGK